MRDPLRPTKIYLITCSVDNKVYVGKTVRPIEIRWTQHKSAASRGDDRYLYKAMRCHGVDNFSIQVVDEAHTDEFGCELEKMFIRWYESTNPEKGYNLTFGGDGVPATPETRRKISETHKRKGTRPPGTANIVRTASWRANISAALKGRTSWNTGKKLSPEIVQKLKDSHPEIELPIEEIIRLRSLGLSYVRVADMFNVSEGTIRNRLKKLGVVTGRVGPLSSGL